MGLQAQPVPELPALGRCSSQTLKGLWICKSILKSGHALAIRCICQQLPDAARRIGVMIPQKLRAAVHLSAISRRGATMTARDHCKSTVYLSAGGLMDSSINTSGVCLSAERLSTLRCTAGGTWGTLPLASGNVSSKPSCWHVN